MHQKDVGDDEKSEDSGFDMEAGHQDDDDTSSVATSETSSVVDYETRRLIGLLKRDRELRVRATRVMGYSGRVWKCDRCPYWQYSKASMRRHWNKAH